MIERYYPEQKKKGQGALWLCRCDCENRNEKIVSCSDLRGGKVKSCGCIHKKYNTYEIFEDYGIGYTTNNDSPFYFDLEDFELIKKFCWALSSKGYIVTHNYSQGKDTTVLLHRFILNPPDDMFVDHKNGKLSRNDNRKENLRICTHQENVWNSDKPSNNTSGVRGVCWYKKYKKWNAKITVNKEVINLGFYDNKEDAIEVRKKAETKYYGEFRYGN